MRFTKESLSLSTPMGNFPTAALLTVEDSSSIFVGAPIPPPGLKNIGIEKIWD
jgi:hypothetical protein